jgi:hypothetical protein
MPAPDAEAAGPCALGDVFTVVEDTMHHRAGAGPAPSGPLAVRP